MRHLYRQPTAAFSLLFLGLIVAAATFAPLLAPFQPDAMNNERYGPPNLSHPFGTDNLGRDILSRVLHGARLSLVVGFIAVGIAATVGTALGVAAGFGSKRLDAVIMRGVDIMLAFPDILLALVIIAILGPGLPNVMIALGVAGIPVYARVVRGATLEVREREYVEAARALGTSGVRVIWRHILPNVVQPVIVIGTLGVATAILAAAGLSFIGLGAPPDVPEWGAMLSSARNYMRRAWWMATFPGLAITLTVLAINLLGDALRDYLDPKRQS